MAIPVKQTNYFFANEDQLQAYCVKWFDEKYPAWRKMLFAVPNGGERPSEIIRGKRVSIEANKLQATGVRRGVADLILVNYDATHFIELKIPGGSQSIDQKYFQASVEERGHDYFLLWTFEEFEALIVKLIGEYE